MKKWGIFYKEYKLLVILWILLLFISVMNIFNLSFAFESVNYIYYGVYLVITVVGALILSRKTGFRVNHLTLLLIDLIAIIISIKNEYIALPLLVIYPFLKSEKSYRVTKIISGFTYIVAVTWIVFFLTFFRISLKPNKVVGELRSPNSNYNLVVISSDGGATGGNITLYLDTRYLNIFKYRETINHDFNRRIDNVYWIDNETFSVNEYLMRIDEV